MTLIQGLNSKLLSKNKDVHTTLLIHDNLQSTLSFNFLDLAIFLYTNVHTKDLRESIFKTIELTKNIFR